MKSILPSRQTTPAEAHVFRASLLGAAPFLGLFLYWMPQMIIGPTFAKVLFGVAMAVAGLSAWAYIGQSVGITSEGLTIYGYWGRTVRFVAWSDAVLTVQDGQLIVVNGNQTKKLPYMGRTEDFLRFLLTYAPNEAWGPSVRPQVESGAISRPGLVADGNEIVWQGRRTIQTREIILALMLGGPAKRNSTDDLGDMLYILTARDCLIVPSDTVGYNRLIALIANKAPATAHCYLPEPKYVGQQADAELGLAKRLPKRS